MKLLQSFVEQHPKSVALLFSELGIHAPATAMNLVLAYGMHNNDEHRTNFVNRLAELAPSESSNADGLFSKQWLNDMLQKGVPAALKLLGTGQKSDTPSSTPDTNAGDQPTDTATSSNWLLWAGVGLALLVIIILIALSVSGTKHKTTTA